MEEEMRYRPVSVQDLLTQLQTTTTLMIDLAYSSVLFNDIQLAEEVIDLEKKVEDLKTHLLMNTAIIIRDAADAEAMVGILEIGTVADMVSHAAGSIASIVILGLGVDSFILEAFTRTVERLVAARIVEGSILVGKSLANLRLETNIGVDIMAVKRGKDYIVNPGPKVTLMEADFLIARGSDVGVSELDKLAKGELKAVPRPRLKV